MMDYDSFSVAFRASLNKHTGSEGTVNKVFDVAIRKAYAELKSGDLKAEDLDGYVDRYFQIPQVCWVEQNI